MDVPLVTELIPWRVRLKLSLLFATSGSKFVPVTITGVPAVPLGGLKPVIVGASLAVTTNCALLVADPDGDETVIKPVVAVLGTVVVIWVAVEELTVAATPLNLTVFCVAVVLKPPPLMTTVVPAAPLPGLKPRITTCPDPGLAMDRMFPTA